jgi:hypothetical protein
MGTTAFGIRRGCVVCGKELTAWQQHEFFGACGDWKCRWVVVDDLRSRTKDSNERERREARQQRARQACDIEHGAERCREWVKLTAFPVPANKKTLTLTPRVRHRRFRRALVKHIRNAFAERPEMPTPPAEELLGVSAPSALPILACATCRGACCSEGGDTAYLTVETIQRYRRSHPTATPIEVLRAYSSCLGQLSYQDSCLCHGAQGCTLPRELRSDVCNHFRCEELCEFEEMVECSREPIFLAAIDDGCQLVRTSTDSPAGTRI